MTHVIQVLNCGSSSIKFAIYDADTRPMPRQPMWGGKVEGIGSDSPTFEQSGEEKQPLELAHKDPYSSALMVIRERIEERLQGLLISCLVHRVLHGGTKYHQPTRVTKEVLADLRSFVPLAPLHQPFALEAIELMLRIMPYLPQVACFDTSFHRTMPEVERILPLPWAEWESGLERYGFHGLSYQYMSVRLPERYGELARGRTIVAHIGSGASLCGMREMKSVCTTMGFTALDGVMMGTRCGALDPGAVIYLMQIKKLSVDEVCDLLYHQSGLLGVSQLSNDPRVLLAAEDTNEKARLALALYVRRIVREIGSMVAALGGLDLLVFTAGVGEHSVEIRRRVCRDLAYLGVEIDEAANEVHGPVISGRNSRVTVGVEPTNEEWIAANNAWAVLHGR